MRKFVFAVVFVSIVWMSSFTQLAKAQTSTGSISGTVLDPQGSAVPDAQLKLTEESTNKEVDSTTDGSGTFRFAFLEIGSYRLEVSKAGFRKFVLDKIGITAGGDKGIRTIKLEVGELSSTIEVTSAQPLLETSEAQITNTFQAGQISLFAGVLENQGLDNLALSVPGVNNNRDLGFSNTNGPGFSVNGLRGRSNDQQVDGQNNNDNSVAGPALAVSDPEFVEQYEITTNNFAPQYGRNSGSVVNVITKSGTNQLHGSAYGTLNSSHLTALTNTQKTFEGKTTTPFLNDEFSGVSLGGPVVRDHLFFFAGFDNEIVNQQSPYTSGSLTPTPGGIATLAACFPGSTSVQALQNFGPYSVTAGNPVPQGGLTPFPLTDSKGVSLCADGAQRTLELSGIQRTLSSGSKSWNFPIKLDFQTEKNHFSGRYFYNKATFLNQDSFGTGASGYPNNVPSLAQDYAFSWTRTLSTRMSNEFRASYGRISVQFGGNAIGNTVPATGAAGTALANILFSDPTLLGFGPATNAPQGRIVNTYQFQDNWSYLVGKHSLKAGVNFTYQRSPNTFLPNLNGQFRFADWGAFGANTPNRIRIASGNNNLDFREKDTFVYFGDDFKVKSNLTLNLGLTWSYYGQPANLFHDRTVKNQTGPNPLWDPTLPLSVTTFPSIPAPKNSFAPSVGFAYTPGANWLTGAGKTVIRGGYRLAYDPPFYNIYLNISSAAPNVLLNSLGRATASGIPLPAAPIGTNVRALLANQLLTGVFDPRRFNETSISPDFGPQRTHEWSLGIQREVAPSAVFEVRYVGNHATNLFQSINGNPEILGLSQLYPNLVPAGLTPCPASQAEYRSAIGRVHCNLGVVRERTNTGYSDYQGLQTEFRANNLWHQLTIKAGYTFSKTTDNVSEIFATGAAGNSAAFSQSQVNYTGQEHGTSGLDFPHNFFATFSESLPMFRSQQGIIGHVLGGWTIAGTYFLASGQPYTAIQGQLNCASGGGACSGGNNSPYDVNFNTSFAGSDGALRPFLGSSGAPIDSVGIYAVDACAALGSGPSCDPTIGNPLVSLNALNATKPTLQLVTPNGVRFIANTATSVAVFGTPFGNVGRNTLRDYWTNIGNAAIFKDTKVTERVKVRFHVTMLNVFNHPNFGTIDPTIDDAGLTGNEFLGFANPRVQNGGSRSIRFGLKIFF